MRVQIPFAYRVDGVNHDGVSVRSDVRIESFAADIREMNEADAPIAFFYLEGPTARSLPHVVRIGSGGSFYRSSPWNVGRGDVKTSIAAGYLDRFTSNGTEVYAGYLAERAIDPKSVEAHKILSWYNRPGMPDDAPPAESLREVHNTDRGLRLIEAQEFAERLAIIDGKIVFQCQEPKIAVALNSDMAPAVVMGWSGSTRLGTVMNQKLGIRVGDPTETRFFRADDLEGAKAFIAERGIDNHMDYAREFICRLPQVMTFDPATEFAERMAVAVVELTTGIIGNLEAEAIQSWLLLREGTRSMTADAIMDHVRMLMPHVGSAAKRLEMREAITEWEHFTGADAKAAIARKPSP
ncbi:hypothetical protein O9X98_14475 [Agrobacterium salinitolerans]|nr:hypothetical protein [Agrobacterium salinitolerans]